MRIGEVDIESRESIWRYVKQIFRKIFLEDWLVKLVALAVTLALWLGVTGLSTPTTTRLTGIPLTLRFASNTEVTNSPIQEVDIVISGDERRVRQLNRNDLIMSVDLSELPPGDRVITLLPEKVTIELPPGVKLDEIRPTRIAVRIEPVIEKLVEVQIDTVGEVAEGYEVYSHAVSPAQVTLRGPASFIQALTSVSTEAIDLSGRTSDIVFQQTPLDLAHPKASVVEAAVDVTIRIGQTRMERIFLVPLADDSGRRATVVLYGPRTLLLDTEVEQLRVDPNEANNGLPRLTLPPPLEGNVEVRRLSLS
ncbi:MAG TPA: CdaR family protein [Pyrinomonadaceae bacterium]|nr:CdaR family protein [Pyrinomonadaceae bacterium]